MRDCWSGDMFLDLFSDMLCYHNFWRVFMNLRFQFLTNVFDDVENGGLEELVHGLLCESQHSLGRPLYYVHTDTHKHTRKTEMNQHGVGLISDCEQTTTTVCHTLKRSTLTCSSSGRPPHYGLCVSCSNQWRRRAGRCWGRWLCRVPLFASLLQMQWWDPPKRPGVWLWSSGWSRRQRFDTAWPQKPGQHPLLHRGRLREEKIRRC